MGNDFSSKPREQPKKNAGNGKASGVVLSTGDNKRKTPATIPQKPKASMKPLQQASPKATQAATTPREGCEDRFSPTGPTDTPQRATGATVVQQWPPPQSTGTPQSATGASGLDQGTPNRDPTACSPRGLQSPWHSKVFGLQPAASLEAAFPPVARLQEQQSMTANFGCGPQAASSNSGMQPSFGFGPQSVSASPGAQPRFPRSPSDAQRADAQLIASPGAIRRSSSVPASEREVAMASLRSMQPLAPIPTMPFPQMWQPLQGPQMFQPGPMWPSLQGPQLAPSRQPSTGMAPSYGSFVPPPPVGLPAGPAMGQGTAMPMDVSMSSSGSAPPVRHPGSEVKGAAGPPPVKWGRGVRPPASDVEGAAGPPTVASFGAAQVPAGARVVVGEDLHYNGKDPLERGTQGSLVKVDGSGDALIDFDDHGKKRWILKGDLDKLELKTELHTVETSSYEPQMYVHPLPGPPMEAQRAPTSAGPQVMQDSTSVPMFGPPPLGMSLSFGGPVLGSPPFAPDGSMLPCRSANNFGGSMTIPSRSAMSTPRGREAGPQAAEPPPGLAPDGSTVSGGSASYRGGSMSLPNGDCMNTPRDRQSGPFQAVPHNGMMVPNGSIMLDDNAYSYGGFVHTARGVHPGPVHGVTMPIPSRGNSMHMPPGSLQVSFNVRPGASSRSSSMPPLGADGRHTAAFGHAFNSSGESFAPSGGSSLTIPMAEVSMPPPVQSAATPVRSPETSNYGVMCKSQESSAQKVSETCSESETVSRRMSELLSLCKSKVMTSRRSAREAENKLHMAEKDMARIGQDWRDLENELEGLSKLYDSEVASPESNASSSQTVPEHSLESARRGLQKLSETMSRPKVPATRAEALLVEALEGPPAPSRPAKRLGGETLLGRLQRGGPAAPRRLQRDPHCEAASPGIEQLQSRSSSFFLDIAADAVKQNPLLQGELTPEDSNSQPVVQDSRERQLPWEVKKANVKRGLIEVPCEVETSRIEVPCEVAPKGSTADADYITVATTMGSPAQQGRQQNFNGWSTNDAFERFRLM